VSESSSPPLFSRVLTFFAFHVQVLVSMFHTARSFSFPPKAKVFCSGVGSTRSLPTGPPTLIICMFEEEEEEEEGEEEEEEGAAAAAAAEVEEEAEEESVGLGTSGRMMTRPSSVQLRRRGLEIKR
jgi:hypothetical protein